MGMPILTEEEENLITPCLDLPILISSLNHQSNTLKDFNRSFRGPFHKLINDKTIGLGTTNKTQDLLQLRKRPFITESPRSEP